MAIIIQQQKKKMNWFALLIFLFFFAVIFGGAYFLFFTPLPGIEIIVPTTLKSAGKLSQVDFDSSKIITDPKLKTLRQYGDLPNTGELGRDNPFLGF